MGYKTDDCNEEILYNEKARKPECCGTGCEILSPNTITNTITNLILDLLKMLNVDSSEICPVIKSIYSV